MPNGMPRVTLKICRKIQPVWLGFALRVIDKIRMFRPQQHYAWRRFARTSTRSRQSMPSAGLTSPSQ